MLQTKDLLVSRTDDLIVDALEISQRTTNLVSRSFDLLLHCLVTQFDLLDPLLVMCAGLGNPYGFKVRV
jgi:hypothetical protein